MASRGLTFYFPARTLILVTGEVGVLFVSFLLATLIQFRGNAYLILGFQNGIYKIALVAAIGLLCMYYLDLYNTPRVLPRGEMQFRVLIVVGTLSLLLGVLGTLFPHFLMGNYVFLTGLPILIFLVISWRKAFFALTGSEQFVQRTIILADGEYSNTLWKEAEDRPELGLRLVGYVSPERNFVENPHLCRLGGLEDLGQIIRDHDIQRVVVTMKDRRGKLPIEDLLKLKTHGLIIEDASDFYETVTGRVPIESLRLSWLLFSKGFGPSRFYLIFSRIASTMVAALHLAISLPLLLIIAITILLDTGAPILFRQKRVGKNGKEFTLYKFRSMRLSTDSSTKLQPTAQGDERITWTGRWLRRTRLDELPQLYNILTGEMSFVGPRPFMIEEEYSLASQIPFYEQRWSVNPGLTGWAQIQRAYCTTLDDNRDKLSYDLFYIKNMSISLDLLILFQTIKIVLLGRGSR